MLTNTIWRTADFSAWLTALRDQKAKQRILARIRSAELGNFGDYKQVGEGVNEMRIHVGPGYRLYYCRRGETVYLLLAGGDKSTQTADIERAKQIMRAFG